MTQPKLIPGLREMIVKGYLNPTNPAFDWSWLIDALDEAEHAETRIWNDAIEAAAKIADQAFNMIEFAPGCDKMQDWDRDEIADAIRALRKE